MSPSGKVTFLTLPGKDAFLHLDYFPSDDWFIEEAYPGNEIETIVFYINTNVKGDTVYANGFRNNGELN